jgi:ZIP family zinc transporter
MLDFSTYSPLILAMIGTGFTFFCTTAGAAVVFFFRGEIKDSFQKTFLGFAAGVMIAASVFSLLIPAIELAEKQNQIGWIPAAGGFFLGALFLLLLDNLLPHLHPGSSTPEGLPSKIKRTTMLVFAITLHNIPEGMAVGLTFGLVAFDGGNSASIAAAFALALGIGLQNIPEGAAVSLPLKSEGFSRTKAFIYGSLSGFVEPLAAVIGVLLAGYIVSVMPWLLAFAAGAMIYVVVEELIPAARLGEHSHTGTMSVMAGFLVMMILDVALG